MKKTIIARHNANQQVLLRLNDNREKFSQVPIMIRLLSELEKMVDETEELITKGENIPGKTAGNKNLAKSELIAVSLKVSNIVKAFAFTTKNENLANFIVSSNNALAHQMRDQELLEYSKNLLDRINSFTAELADYGLTEELKQELDTEIKDYEHLMTEPRKLISERKTTNELTEDKIAMIQSMLSNQLDPMMELFVDDKEFYLAYKSARMIVDPATRKKSEENKEDKQAEN
jgi:hypothetical protein